MAARMARGNENVKEGDERGAIGQREVMKGWRDWGRHDGRERTGEVMRGGREDAGWTRRADWEDVGDDEERRRRRGTAKGVGGALKEAWGG